MTDDPISVEIQTMGRILREDSQYTRRTMLIVVLLSFIVLGTVLTLVLFQSRQNFETARDARTVARFVQNYCHRTPDSPICGGINGN